MRVLKNNYNKKSKLDNEVEHYPRKMECECCSSELEYNKEDVYIGAYGGAYVRCPLCRYSNVIDGHEDEITLTVDNVRFPVHFHHVCKEEGAVDISSEEIEEWIRESIECLRRNKDEGYYHFHASGNTWVTIFRFEGDEEYEVVVTKDYYNTYIPFEREDY